MSPCIHLELEANKTVLEVMKSGKDLVSVGAIMFIMDALHICR